MAFWSGEHSTMVRATTDVLLQPDGFRGTHAAQLAFHSPRLVGGDSFGLLPQHPRETGPRSNEQQWLSSTRSSLPSERKANDSQRLSSHTDHLYSEDQMFDANVQSLHMPPGRPGPPQHVRQLGRDGRSLPDLTFSGAVASRGTALHDYSPGAEMFVHHINHNTSIPVNPVTSTNNTKQHNPTAVKNL